MDRRLLSFAEVRAMLPQSRSALYRDMTAGLLEWVQVGARRYFEPEAIDRYIAALKADRPAVEQLVELIDDAGRIDVALIPSGCTLADLEAAKRIIAGRSVDAAA